MNLNKHQEFFDPTALNKEVHIIGVGAIGSTLAEMFTRLGFEELCLYDIDTVDEHNLTNQMYRFKDIGKTKLESIKEILTEINPDIKINVFNKGYRNDIRLSGYVFLTVDNIELRKQICMDQLCNQNIDYMADFRMELTSAQTYACPWQNERLRKHFISTMNFTEAEAKAATPVSACGTTLSITPTVRVVVSLGTTNFINYIQGNPYKTMIITDPFHLNTIYFPE